MSEAAAGPGLVIDRVRAGDVDAIAALARAIWFHHYPGIITHEQIEYMLAQRYGRERLLEELRTPGIWWDQAWLDGRRVGFASSLRIDAGTGLELKLDKIYVDPEVQRRGVGAALIARSADRGRELGARALILAVNKNNVNAIAAYRKHGFVVRDSVCVDIGKGFVMDDYIMAKSL